MAGLGLTIWFIGRYLFGSPGSMARRKAPWRYTLAGALLTLVGMIGMVALITSPSPRPLGLLSTITLLIAGGLNLWEGRKVEVWRRARQDLALSPRLDLAPPPRRGGAPAAAAVSAAMPTSTAGGQPDRATEAAAWRIDDLFPPPEGPA
jgi:hypothetical protein